MQRLLSATLAVVASATLALDMGCHLDPQSVGDEGTDGGTSITSGGGDGTPDPDGNDASATTGGPMPEPGAGEVLEEWEGVEYYHLLLSSDDLVLALGIEADREGGTVYTFETTGRLNASGTWIGRFVEAFAVGVNGYVALGGRSDNGVDPVGAYLWLLGDDGDIPVHEVMLAGGSSFVAEVGVGGGMLWTLTAESMAPEDPQVGVLRRHGSEGAVELTHPLLVPSSTLAVDVDGYAYSIGGSDPPQLHRVAPEGGIDWALPVGLGVTGQQVLHARQGAPGVVIVSDVAGGLHVQELDGGGISLHEIFVPAVPSELAPASEVGDAVVLAHPLPPDGYVVEARDMDGSQLWSATRSVVGATSVDVVDVLEIPGGAVVIGQAERGGVGFGFIRFVVVP